MVELSYTYFLTLSRGCSVEVNYQILQMQGQQCPSGVMKSLHLLTVEGCRLFHPGSNLWTVSEIIE